MFTESTEGPLETEIILLSVLILDEVIVFLIDGIISQMHVLVVLIDLRSIGLTGETSEAFLENIDTHGFIRGDEDIDTEVELVAVDEERVGDISTDDGGVIDVDIINVIY